jgi:hypothetical protein
MAILAALARAAKTALSPAGGVNHCLGYNFSILLELGQQLCFNPAHV